MVAQIIIFVHLLFHALKFCRTIDRAVVKPGHGKYVVDGLQRITKLAIEDVLNNELIFDEPDRFKFI